MANNPNKIFGSNGGLARVRGKIVGVDAHHVGETAEFVVVLAMSGHKPLYTNYFTLILLFADLKGENIGKKSLKIHSVGVEGLGILSRMGH